MSILLPDRNIEELEHKLDWDAALLYCHSEWREHKNDLDALLRALTEAWYLLSYWEQLFHIIDGKPTLSLYCNPNYKYIFDVIHETVTYGSKYFLNEPKYLCVAGYLMRTQPEWFVTKETDYSIWQETGMKMLGSVSVLGNDECSIFRQIIDGNLTVDREIILSLFPGESEVDLYFRSMLSCGR